MANILPPVNIQLFCGMSDIEQSNRVAVRRNLRGIGMYRERDQAAELSTTCFISPTTEAKRQAFEIDAMRVLTTAGEAVVSVHRIGSQPEKADGVGTCRDLSVISCPVLSSLSCTTYEIVRILRVRQKKNQGPLWTGPDRDCLRSVNERRCRLDDSVEYSSRATRFDIARWNCSHPLSCEMLRKSPSWVA